MSYERSSIDEQAAAYEAWRDSEMAQGKYKTEHNGAKNGGGGYGYRHEVKAASKKLRRAADKKEARNA